MQAITSIKPLIVVLLPAIAAILIMLTGNKKPNVREAWSFIGGIITCLINLTMVPDILSGNVIQYTVFKMLPGISVKLTVDALGIIFAIVASFLWILATSYNVGYMRALKEHAQTRYYACFSIAITGAMGVALAGNVFTLYLFYEIISIFTYPLVAHHQDEEGYEGARKYISYLMFTSKGFLLPAMALTYVLAGTLDFPLGDFKNGIFPADADPTLVTIAYVLYLAGFAKAAIMPLHNWLPSAMVAPTPVSALLHAVAVVKAGVFSISRTMLSVFGVGLLTHLGLGLPTAYVVAFTILTASVIALTKDNLKARLAYSTISQLSYVIIGVALLTPSGITGGIIHIANHAFSKITLFFCAGAIYVATHKKEISQLSGLGRQMPFTMGAFAIGALSMIGVPPVAGFVSKWYLLLGTLETKHLGLILVLLASTILNAGYFSPIVFKAFFEKSKDDNPPVGIQEAPYAMVVPLTLTAIISVIIGIYPDFFMNFVKMVVK
jgi:multicomponent Na+:H+ antiporter subunit D